MQYKKFIISILGSLLPLLTIAQAETEMPPAPKVVLFIGDSITDGAWGNSGGGPKASEERNLWDCNHIYGHGYMCFVAAHFQSLYPERDFVFHNRGISGNTLADLESRWQKDVLALEPDVLSILIGTNDVDKFLKTGASSSSFDAEGWKARYRALIDEAKAGMPGLRIVLCTPFVANVGKMKQTADFARRDLLVRTLAQKVEELAAECDAVAVPFGTLFDTLLQADAPSDTYWIWDGIHPTMAGHRRMADLWILQAAPLLFPLP